MGTNNSNNYRQNINHNGLPESRKRLLLYQFKTSSDNEVLRKLHEELIKGTHPGADVEHKTVFLGYINPKAVRHIGIKHTGIYITSSCLKHLYDKRAAQEYDCLLNIIPKIVKYPDLVYKNKDIKRGDFIFVKAVNGFSYMSSLQSIKNRESSKLSVVTAFAVKPSYMRNFKLLWSWRGNTPHSIRSFSKNN
jgi:hypothetical protein